MSDEDSSSSTSTTVNNSDIVENISFTYTDVFLYYYTLLRIKGKSRTAIKRIMRKKVKRLLMDKIAGIAS
ncbi:MAG: hypothetical protein QXF76_01565 [Candidatus Anstonellales archaeon]